MDGSTISSSEWTTELMLDNGNDENEVTDDNENKNARENEDRNKNKTTKAGTKAGEKADIIEKNKATTHPFVISTDAGNALIPDEKLSENSTLTKVTMRAGIRIFIHAKIVDISEIFFLKSRKDQRFL